MDKYEPQKWFVTGASGLVGYSVTKCLREKNYDVICLVRETTDKTKISKIEKLGAKVVYGDLLDNIKYQQALGECDVVVHTAASVRSKFPEKYWEINVEGTKAICQSMSDENVKRLVHISTCGVYGLTGIEETDETFQPIPTSDYRESKYQAERVILDEFGNEINATIIRPPYIFGDSKMERHVYSTLLSGVPKKISFKIFKKNPYIGFAHAEDIAGFVVRVGCEYKTKSEIYNIQSLKIQLNDLLDSAYDALNINPMRVVVPYSIIVIITFILNLVFKVTNNKKDIFNRLKYLNNNWIFSTTRAENEHGFKAKYTDKDELRKLIEQYATNNNLRLND